MCGSGGGSGIGAWLPFVALGLALSGCSFGSDEGLARQAVEGTVLLDGRRLAHGSILFLPEERPAKDNDSVPAGDLIVNGRFSIPRQKGLTPGMYKIMIFGERKHPRGEKFERPESPGTAKPAVEEKIPAKFNSETELELDFKEGIKDLKIEIDSN